jgi:putative acetyltransferase
MNIRRETSNDVPKIRIINMTAFGSRTEADIVDVLRSNGPRAISLVAAEDATLLGHIMFSPVDVPEAPDLQAMALGPMAVTPERQRTGVGSALVRAGLEECRRAGAAAVFVVGHPSYYPRFGFAMASTLGFRCEFDVADDAFMVSELAPGALLGRSGVVHFHKAFGNG